MNTQHSKALFIALLALTLFQCNNTPGADHPAVEVIKLHPTDPFKNTIVKSQLFAIDGKQDNVIEGENGTVVVCPKGCFKNAKGEIVEGKVTIELSEALSLEAMLLSNLTTTSNGKPLETDGMIYFNALANGEKLSINTENPIHIEIPTTKKKAGMSVYRGIRDKNGNMNWVDPKELDKFLVTLDINSLDFLPTGFQAEVEKGMPYKNHTSATQELTDSLYYSLSFSTVADTIAEVNDETSDYNEPYYNKGSKVVNGRYTSDSYRVRKADSIRKTTEYSSYSSSGVDPAIIKVIKSKKYQHTFIATREFEARLKVIFSTCNNAVLEAYINNLDKNLYEVDSIAAKLLKAKSYLHNDFINFSRQRLTKVKEADKYAILLKGYYDGQLKKVKAALEREYKKALNALQKQDEEAQKVVENYKGLLWKREKYRMETYGFNWTQTGWINVDKGIIPKAWGPKSLEIVVTNGKQFDRVHTYVIYTSIKSLYRLNTSDNQQFYVGNAEEKTMLMPKKERAVVIAIGYKDETPAFSVKEFNTGSTRSFSLTLSPSSLEELKDAIRPYEKYAKENDINTDLEFMAKFYKEKQRRKALEEEHAFILRLSRVAYPCLSPLEAVFN